MKNLLKNGFVGSLLGICLFLCANSTQAQREGSNKTPEECEQQYQDCIAAADERFAAATDPEHLDDLYDSCIDEGKGTQFCETIIDLIVLMAEMIYDQDLVGCKTEKGLCDCGNQENPDNCNN